MFVLDCKYRNEILWDLQWIHWFFKHPKDQHWIKLQFLLHLICLNAIILIYMKSFGILRNLLKFYNILKNLLESNLLKLNLMIFMPFLRFVMKSLTFSFNHIDFYGILMTCMESQGCFIESYGLKWNPLHAYWIVMIFMESHWFALNLNIFIKLLWSCWIQFIFMQP